MVSTTQRAHNVNFSLHHTIRRISAFLKRTFKYRFCSKNQPRKRYLQEAQLMLTTGSTRLAVSRGQQTKHGTILGPLRLFAKHVIGTTQ